MDVGEAGDIEEGIKFVHSDSPYTYKDNELGKTFKAELEDIENQQQILKVDKQLMDLELSPDKDVSVLKNLPPIKKE